MPTLNFPGSPSLNEEYTFEGKVWRYNGSGWGLLTRSGAAGVLVKTATSEFEAARVVTDSPTMVADWSTLGVVKLNVVGGGSAAVPVDFKDSVAVATTANIALSGEQIIDGILTSASRVLVKDQTAGKDNGIYVSAAGAWVRATDADASDEVTSGLLVLAEDGTDNGNQVFILTTTGTIVLGTTALAFQAVAIPTNVFVGRTVSGTTYTTKRTDSGKRLNATNAGTKTITIAKQSTVNHAVNTEIEICNIGAGLLTIAPDTGVTLNSLSSTLTVPQYHCVKVKKRANPNTWEVTGVHYRIYDATWFDVTDPVYGATGDGTTDDTVAIQAAIDACEAAGGGTVYFPRGVYVVNGALQDTGRSNSQLLLPRRDYADTEAITIVLRGEAAPSAVFSVLGATPVQNNLSVIKGTLNTGSGSLIGAQGPVGTFELFTNILLRMVDITVQMPANPLLTALDLSKVAQIDLDNIEVHTGNFDIATLAMQTTATSYGVRTPSRNNGALTRLGVVNVAGFYNGFEIAEHCVGQSVSTWGCKRGFVFVAAFHASAFTRLQTVHCQTGMVFTGGEHDVSIQQYNIEHAASGTWVVTYDVDDASNYARGFLYWHVILAASGIHSGFLSNGAVYLRRERLQRCAGVLALTDAATVTIDCNQTNNLRWGIGGNRTFANPTSPWDGQVINLRIIQDATGNRTWTLGSKFKFAGGSPLLSTAAAAKDFVSCQYDAADDTWNCRIDKAMA